MERQGHLEMVVLEHGLKENADLQLNILKPYHYSYPKPRSIATMQSWYSSFIAVPSAVSYVYLFVKTMPLLDDERTVDVEGKGYDCGKHWRQHCEHHRLCDLQNRKNTSQMEHISVGTLQKKQKKNLKELFTLSWSDHTTTEIVTHFSHCFHDVK